MIGERDAILDRLRSIQPIGIKLEVFAVQPGISAHELQSEEHNERVRNVRQIIAATNDSVAMQQSNQFWLVSP